MRKTRPKHLPEFERPPLSEVVLGVQFAPPQGYHQLLAYKVWELFKADYPVAQELPAIPPAFETFGLPHPGSLGQNFNFGIVTGAVHDRFWFLRADQDELIQFQNDRLLHNWRKVDAEESQYPRFEYMAERFQDNLSRFQEFAAKLAPQALAINQCEISYINHLFDPSSKINKPGEWLTFLDYGNQNVEDFATSFRTVITSDEGKPRGRLICEASTGMNQHGQKTVVLTLTVRGPPKNSSIEAALQFMSEGREIIVTKFAELTTPAAHDVWRRTK